MGTASGKWLAGIATVVVALMVVSLAIGLTVGRGMAKSLPESEPEGIVQRYILAMQERDYQLAHSYFSQELKGSCTEEHLRMNGRWFAERSKDERIALTGKETLRDGRIEVRVQVTDVHVSPPFGVNEYGHEERYILKQEDSQWRLDDPPWPVGWCPGLENRPPKPGELVPVY
jgi:hypothetical protein